jgi:glutamate-5-semialdehyde dehydrogenase
MSTQNPLDQLGYDAKQASAVLAHASTEQKNKALQILANKLRQEQGAILNANAQDMDAAYASGLSDALCDRLKLDAARLESIAKGVETVAALPDPVDHLLHETIRPNGLRIEKVSVPLGVIGVIFEARPNVAIDAAILCLKAGNACILRGGKDSFQSVSVLTRIMQDSLREAGLPEQAVQTIPSVDRALVGALLQLDRYVDVIVPRGGKDLIARVRTESRIPVFSHLDGICHTYIDEHCDSNKAIAVTLNAKMRRTGICGATECLVLHKSIADTIGRDIIATLIDAGCAVKVPEAWLHLHPQTTASSTSDYGCEFLAPIIAVQIVDDVAGAVTFINAHNSQHTDAIITEDAETARFFQKRVNSAIAVHNASTQFADGGEFGMGAEIGIATGKLHARGPVGLEQLVTYQYRVHGTGQTRA